MSDLIRREDALHAIGAEIVGVTSEGRQLLDMCQFVIKQIPSAEPIENFEWCHDCKEYDQEKHCCHRWTKVIRKTVEEMQLSGKMAKVIDRRYDHNLRRYGRCENCHCEVVERYTYCPNCGARLEWE